MGEPRKCQSPEHLPARDFPWPPGQQRHTCPACGAVIAFYVPRTSEPTPLVRSLARDAAEAVKRLMPILPSYSTTRREVYFLTPDFTMTGNATDVLRACEGGRETLAAYLKDLHHTHVPEDL